MLTPQPAGAERPLAMTLEIVRFFAEMSDTRWQAAIG